MPSTISRMAQGQRVKKMDRDKSLEAMKAGKAKEKKKLKLKQKIQGLCDSTEFDSITGPK